MSKQNQRLLLVALVAVLLFAQPVTAGKYWIAYTKNNNDFWWHYNNKWNNMSRWFDSKCTYPPSPKERCHYLMDYGQNFCVFTGKQQGPGC